MRNSQWAQSVVAGVLLVGCGGEATDNSDRRSPVSGGGTNSEGDATESEQGSEGPEQITTSDLCRENYVSVEVATDGESLSKCENIAGTLDFRGGTDSPSLESIETINEKLHFQLTTLEDASVFAGLREVGTLEIEANGALESLDGLENLETVWAGIYIHDNPALVDLSALHGVRLMGGPVQISGNIRLPTCQVEDLINALTENNSNIDEVYETDTVSCE